MSLLINTIFILIHGTWGADSAWYQPHGDFFRELSGANSPHGIMIVPFRWSGHNTDPARRQAAAALKHVIQSYAPHIRLCIVGHSHGGNVVLLASEVLGLDSSMHKRIDAVYLLGTPVNPTAYIPNMNVINNLYNIISFEDIIQSVVGFFGREQLRHPHIANLSITIDGKEPDHEGLHSAAIGRWLLHVDEMIHQQKAESFCHFSYDKPGIIHFYEQKKPEYSIDTQWSSKIERDAQLNTLMLNAITRSPRAQNIYKLYF